MTPAACIYRPSPSRPCRSLSSASALLVACLSVLMAAPAHADKVDHERARQAVEAGLVLPLPVVLERLQREQPGNVLEVELEQERNGGLWVYEIRLLRTGGGLVKLKLDARTGAVLPQAARRPDRERPGDKPAR